MGVSVDNLELIRQMLLAVGDDPSREGLLDTPKRVVKSWDELYSGYKMDPAEVLGRTFESGGYDQLVLLKDIEFYSMCEHHMLPFFGKIHIGYIPNKRVVGISKLARLVEVFARRLQIQEKMCDQIADSIVKHLDTDSCMVVAEAQHLCMVSRGVGKQNSVMVTSSVHGAFKNATTKQEFLSLIK